MPDGAGRGGAAKVAIVHERFTELGGSEAVVAALRALWADSEVLAPVVDPRSVPDGLRDLDIRTSPLQRLYRGGRHSLLVPLLPAAIGRLAVGSPDLVVISHHSFAHRVRVAADIPVLSYVHSPARWIWEPESRSHELRDPIRQAMLAGLAAWHRDADRAAAARPDVLLANSSTVQDRIRRWWGRESTVVPPPVDVAFYRPNDDQPREDFLLFAGRLVPGKRPDVAVKAAQRFGFRLVVVGEGRMRRDLERLAEGGVQFTGAVDRETLRQLFRRCQAVLVPAEEDFGIVPVEAMACGSPVVGLGLGGVVDSVVPDRTGLLYPPTGDAVGDLGAAVQAVRRQRFDHADIRRHSLQFGADRFATRLRAEAEALIARGKPAPRSQAPTRRPAST